MFKYSYTVTQLTIPINMVYYCNGFQKLHGKYTNLCNNGQLKKDSKERIQYYIYLNNDKCKIIFLNINNQRSIFLAAILVGRQQIQTVCVKQILPVSPMFLRGTSHLCL